MREFLALFAVAASAQCQTSVVFEYAKWIGGSASVAFAAIDRSGDLYLTGTTTSADFPATGSFTGGNGTASVFFVKVDRITGQLRYSFLLRGVTVSSQRGLAVGPRGELHTIVGENAPRLGPQFAESSSQFVLTLSPEGDRIERSSGLGLCSSPNSPIQVDRSGKVVAALACHTNSMPEEQYYLFRIDRDTVSRTPIPNFQARGLAVDMAGNAVVTGWTLGSRPYAETSQSLPADRTESRRSDVAVVKVGPDGKLIAAVRFGGSGDDQGISVDIDEMGEVYVFGSTKVSLDRLEHPVPFPVTDIAADRIERDGLFAAKLNSSLNQLLWSTYVPAHKDKDKIPAFAWLTGRGEFAVATTKLLATVSIDGRVVSDQTRVASGHASIAGSGGHAVVYSTRRYPHTARLEPLIPTGEQYSWFASIDLYRTDAPELELSVGELEFAALALPHDGTSYASGMPVGVRAGEGEFELVHGELGGHEFDVPNDTPSEIASGPSTVTISSAKIFPRAYFFLAAGVRNGLQVLEYNAGFGQPSVRVDRNVASIPQNATEPVTVDAMLSVWNFTPYWGFTEISAGYEVSSVSQPWLTVTPTTGQAPAAIQFRVDPTKLPNASVGSAQVVFTPGFPQNSRITFVASRPSANPTPLVPQFSVTPQTPEFIMSGPRAVRTRTIRITSTGEDIDFTLAPSPILSLSANGGRTPAEITVTAAQQSEFSPFLPQIIIQGPRQGATLQGRLITFHGGLLEGLRFRDTSARYSRTELLVPIYMLPMDMFVGAYQFRCAGQDWHVLGVEDARSESSDVKWTLLTPSDARLGPCRFEMLTPNGELLASRDIVVREAAPFASSRANFADGTLVGPATGVRPGEWVKIPSGGLGIVSGGDGEPTHVADGFVYLGERRLQSVTRMSPDEAGLYEVWAQIPAHIGYGDHFLRVSFTGSDTLTRIPVRVLRPAD